MAVEEMMRWQMFGGGFTAAIDLPALLAFIAFAVMYLLVPVLGYQAQRRAGMAAALYLLIGYMGLALVQFLAQVLQMLDRTRALGLGHGEGAVFVLFVFAFLKMVVFLLAMLAFVTGLRSLRPRPPSSERFYEDVDVKPR
jgi:hypothetical protein